MVSPFEKFAKEINEASVRGEFKSSGDSGNVFSAGSQGVVTTLSRSTKSRSDMSSTVQRTPEAEARTDEEQSKIGEDRLRRWSKQREADPSLTGGSGSSEDTESSGGTNWLLIGGIALIGLMLLKGKW